MKLSKHLTSCFLKQCVILVFGFLIYPTSSIGQLSDSLPIVIPNINPSNFVRSNFYAKHSITYSMTFEEDVNPGQIVTVYRTDSTLQRVWLEDQNGKRISVKPYISNNGSISFDDLKSYFWSESKVRSIQKRYGLKVWKTILNGEVMIGWNKELCKLSWGDPSYINTTTSAGMITEQWVYGSSYLYFRNGKLETVQN